MIKYFGKCLLIKSEGKKILVVGDLHIGKGDNESESGNIVMKENHKQMIEEMKFVFKKIKNISEIILLGDIKHNFLNPDLEEKYDIINFLDFLEQNCKKIIIIKGNHDRFFGNNLNMKKINFCDRYIFKEFAFLHGDKNFKDIYEKNIKYWIMGHMHPSLSLNYGNKIERYKCFLEGKYKDKTVIILPSFNNIVFGYDVRTLESNLYWKFNFLEFNISIVSDDMKILDFGKLKNIIN